MSQEAVTRAAHELLVSCVDYNACDLCRQNKAVLLYQRAVNIGEKALGSGHPNVATVRDNLNRATSRSTHCKCCLIM